AEAVQGGMGFELLGVKAVRAFDATVVIVSLAAQGEGSGHRVVGSYLTEDDAARGAALAVLNASKRLLGNRRFMREAGPVVHRTASERAGSRRIAPRTLTEPSLRAASRGVV